MNKSKSDQIHEQLPKLLNTRGNENWSALIDALSEEDERLAKLIAQVREQFFVKTASRPYIDRLAANNNISRPRFIGINDAEFRKYIPILSYQPKQVKQTINLLLDLFFFKEATTAFLSSSQAEPFSLKDGWDLHIKVDNVYTEDIVFLAKDFSNIDSISANEIAAAYNRQSKYTYATVFFDGETKDNYIRIFTNTIGSEGSLEVIGGLANIGLCLNGFMLELGNGANTQWRVTRVGDLTTFEHTGGVNPGINKLEAGDVVLSTLPNNEGSFEIVSVDAPKNSFSFINLFSTPGVVAQTDNRQVKFLRPEKVCTYRSTRRALAWETTPGKVTVEIPTTSSILRRNLKGGFHINGSTAYITKVNNDGSITLDNVEMFPSSGSFLIEPVNEITIKDSDSISVDISNGRVISNFTRYTYSSISGNTLEGINPPLPTIASLNEFPISFMEKKDSVITCSANNTFSVGDRVIIRGSSGIGIRTTTGTTTAQSPILSSIGDITGVIPGQLVNGNNVELGTKVVSVNRLTSTITLSQNAIATGQDLITFSENTNGTFEVVSATPTSFSVYQLGADGLADTPGVASVERMELAEQGSKVILLTSVPASETKILGPYVWDPQAPFVLSSHTTTSIDAIPAGKNIKLLSVMPNTIPDEEGYIIVDYGRNNQEGPIRYTYKPTENTLALDSSYVFQYSHSAGCSIVALNNKGSHTASGLGNEYPPYLTNPAEARLAFQELVKSVSSAGIFIDFLIRYPTQLYGALSVYD